MAAAEHLSRDRSRTFFSEAQIFGEILTKSQRNISMFFRRIAIPLVLEATERGNDSAPRFPRADHGVDEPTRRSDVGVGELLAKLGDMLGSRRGRVRGRLQLTF